MKSNYGSIAHCSCQMELYVDERMAQWLACGQATRHNTEGRRLESWSGCVCVRERVGGISITQSGEADGLDMSGSVSGWGHEARSRTTAPSQPHKHAQCVHTNSYTLAWVSIATPNKQSVHVVTPPRQEGGRNRDSEAKTDIKERESGNKDEGDRRAQRGILQLRNARCLTHWQLKNTRRIIETIITHILLPITGSKQGCTFSFSLYSETAAPYKDFHRRRRNNLIPPVSHGSPLKFHHGGQSPSAQWPHRLQAPTKGPFHWPQSSREWKESKATIDVPLASKWRLLRLSGFQGPSRLKTHEKDTGI